MSRVLIAFAALAVVSAAPAPRAPDARGVLDAAKAATGGAAWDSLEGSYESDKRGITEYRTWLDFRHYGIRWESGPVDAAFVHAFDGKVAWARYPASTIKTTDDPAFLTEAVTTAFVASNGYFYPDRFPATAQYLRTDRIGARNIDVIKVCPEGGRAVELWFDRATHLLGRIVDPGSKPAATVDVSDYRKVGPVLIGFHRVVQLHNGTAAQEMDFGTVVLTKVDRSRFSPPARQ